MRDCVERIVAGYSERWDGNNHVGLLDDDARDAEGNLWILAEALDDPYKHAEFTDEED